MYYLSGKITDADPRIMRSNLQKFYEVERALVARGIDVFNPAKLEEDGRSWEWYLARDLKWINDYRPIIYLMDGWEESRGARLEVEFAKLLKLTILYPM